MSLLWVEYCFIIRSVTASSLSSSIVYVQDIEIVSVGHEERAAKENRLLCEKIRHVFSGAARLEMEQWCEGLWGVLAASACVGPLNRN